MKKSFILIALLFASVFSHAASYSIPTDTRFCSQLGSEIRAVREVGYVVSQNGREFVLTGAKGDQSSLEKAEIVSFELGRTDKAEQTDKIIAALENKFFSHGQIDGLFSFVELNLASGHKVGILKSAKGNVIIQGSTKHCK